MDVFKISVPNGIEVGTFDNTSRDIYIYIYITHDLYFSYLFPWKNRGGIQVRKAKHCGSRLFCSPLLAQYPVMGFDLVHPESFYRFLLKTVSRQFLVYKAASFLQ